MQIIFTTSEKPMARLIRWATGECCSHVAIQHGDQVYHSNFFGVNRVSIEEFLKENTVMHMVEIENSYPNTQKLYEMYHNEDDKYYDIGALLFVGMMILIRKTTGLQIIPKQNLWQSTGMYMCTEFVTKYVDGKADSLITPHKLYERICK